MIMTVKPVSSRESRREHGPPAGTGEKKETTRERNYKTSQHQLALRLTHKSRILLAKKIER